VISSDGLVLVPADFVAAGDEIVVMDGGTDVIRNGRPSRTVKRSAADGLAVLAVAGLARPGILLTQGDPLQGRVFHLAAFPPAEKLAEGARPLWVPVKFVGSDSGGGLTISTATPLPNISGPIVDDCGYLVGLNLATGVPSLAEDQNPVAILGDDLRLILDSMQISLQPGTCGKPAGPGVPEKDDSVADTTPAPLQQAGQINAATAVVPADNGPPTESLPRQMPANSVQDSDVVVQPVEATRGAAAIWRVSSVWLWLWLAAAVILALVLAKLFSLRRQAQPGPQQDARRHEAPSDSAPGEEPDTAPLDSGPGSSTRAAGIKSPEQNEKPDINALPDGCDGIVVIAGRLGNDAGFERFCVVNTAHIDIIIGRGDADICIETPSLSRRHARLANAGESLTITDLGSSNGTFIRGIPCLSAEVMFIEPEDEILLGGVRLHIHVLTSSGTGGAQ